MAVTNTTETRLLARKGKKGKAFLTFTMRRVLCQLLTYFTPLNRGLCDARETGIETNNYHKSGDSKRDFIEGLTLVAPFELGREDQVHSVEDGEKGKDITCGENSMSSSLEA